MPDINDINDIPFDTTDVTETEEPALEEPRVAPAQLIRDRYIPLRLVEEKCGITLKQAKQLIDKGSICYAEFKEPGATYRTPHVDPVEIEAYLERRKQRREAYGAKT